MTAPKLREQEGTRGHEGTAGRKPLGKLRSDRQCKSRYKDHQRMALGPQSTIWPDGYKTPIELEYVLVMKYTGETRDLGGQPCPNIELSSRLES